MAALSPWRPMTIASALSLVFVGAPTAKAQSLTGNVGSAAIAAGERSFETRLGVDADGDAAARLHFDYAFTDWYKLRVIGAGLRPDGGEWDFGGLTFENWFQWRQGAENGSGFNGGVRLAYTFNDGDGPDEAEIRIIFTDEFSTVGNGAPILSAKLRPVRAASTASFLRRALS